TRSRAMKRPVKATVSRVVNGPRPRKATLTTVADTPPLVCAHERDSIQDIAKMGLKAKTIEYDGGPRCATVVGTTGVVASRGSDYDCGVGLVNLVGGSPTRRP